MKICFLEVGTFLNTISSIAGKPNHSRDGFRAEHSGCAHQFFFCNGLFFYDYFGELQTVLIKVKVITINAPLT